MEEIDNTKLDVSESVFQSLDKMVYWSKFLAIVGFIGIGLMVLGALFLFLAGANSNVAEPELLGAMSFLYFIIGVFYYFPINYLYRFAVKTRSALNTQNQSDLDIGLSSLASNFKFIGVMTVVILSIYGFFFLIGFIGAFIGLM